MLLEVKKNYEVYRGHIKSIRSHISPCFRESDPSFIILINLEDTS